MPFENIVGKVDILWGKEKMLVAKQNFNFSLTMILSSANAFSLDQPKIMSFGRGLNTFNPSPNDPWAVFTKHSQEHFFFLQDFVN